MNHEQLIYRPGTKKGLAGFDPRFTTEQVDDDVWRQRVEADALEMADHQDMLMAHEKYGLLLIFQGMDGAGKDSAIKNVMSALDPQGCEMKAFKKQTAKELKHDFLWRAACSAPARGQIAIFNRSYYENVLADRVHPENLKNQNLPKEATEGDIWERRYRHINNFEAYLRDEGIHTLKFYLHMSKDEQARKLLERTERPEKKWKFKMTDIQERKHWNKYMKAFEEAFEHTSTDAAPWYIIPDNNRWFARAAIASIILAKLKSLHSGYPKIDKDQAKEMEEARRILSKEAGSKSK